jgi:hypothetical protein
MGRNILIATGHCARGMWEGRAEEKEKGGGKKKEGPWRHGGQEVRNLKVKQARRRGGKEARRRRARRRGGERRMRDQEARRQEGQELRGIGMREEGSTTTQFSGLDMPSVGLIVNFEANLKDFDFKSYCFHSH